MLEHQVDAWRERYDAAEEALEQCIRDWNKGAATDDDRLSPSSHRPEGQGLHAAVRPHGRRLLAAAGWTLCCGIRHRVLERIARQKGMVVESLIAPLALDQIGKVLPPWRRPSGWERFVL